MYKNGEEINSALSVPFKSERVEMVLQDFTFQFSLSFIVFLFKIQQTFWKKAFFVSRSMLLLNGMWINKTTDSRKRDIGLPVIL